MRTHWIPLSCFECRQWSVFEITQMNGGAIMKCTHCEDRAFMHEAEINIEKFLFSMKIFMRKACCTFPDVHKLQRPGDHIEPPKLIKDDNVTQTIATQNNQEKEKQGLDNVRYLFTE